MRPLRNADFGLRIAKREAAVTALEAMSAIDDSAIRNPQSAIAKATLSQYAQLWYRGQENAVQGGLNEPLSPYQQSLWVYRCVSEICRAVKGIPVRISRRAGGSPARSLAKAAIRPLAGRKAVRQGKAAAGDLIESGPAWEFLAHPNAYQDWTAFVECLVGYLLLRGSAAIVDLAGEGAGTHVIDGRRIGPKWRRDQRGLPVLLGYLYKPAGGGAEVPLLVEEVKYFALWDDGDDPMRGMSPNTPGRLAIATEYNASLYNASSLVNSCEPGMTIAWPADKDLTDEQRQSFELTLKRRFQGPARAKLPLLLEGGADVKTIATTMADMQFNEGKKTNRLEICCLYGVPPVVAGWVEAAGDSSAYTQNALRQFYQQTVFPLLDGLAPAIQGLVSARDESAEAWFDVEDQPVVQEMRLARVDTATKFFAMGYPPNAINEVLDLGLPALPWGDTGFLPLGVIPAAEAAAGMGGRLPALDEGPTTPGGDELDQPGELRNAECGLRIPRAADLDRDGNPKSEIRNPQSDAVPASIWRAWFDSWAPLARTVERTLRSRYFAQQRILIAAIKRDFQFPIPNSQLNNARPDAEDGSAAVKLEIGNRKSAIDDLLVSIFADPDDRARFRARMRSHLTAANELGVRQALAESGLAGAALDAAVRKLLADPSILAALARESVILSTRIDEYTRRVLRRSLLEGLESGETTLELADRVQSVMGNRRRAALVVARNSVGQALSSSRHAAQVAAGNTHKIWIHGRVPGAKWRPAHVAYEPVTRANPVPIDTPFVINGYSLMYPRDYSTGAVGECVNCQCLSLARRLAPGQTPKAAEFVAPWIGRDFQFSISNFQLEAGRADAGDQSEIGNGKSEIEGVHRA